MQKITPFLWFDTQAEDAVNFYVSIFKNSVIKNSTRYTKESAQTSGRAEGSIMTINFELNGQKFTALNGGPVFKFTEAISFVVSCADQAEIDYYWDKLSEGSDPKSQQCGWLKDKFGISWQIVPENIAELTKNSNAMATLMYMQKIDIKTLEEASK
jgi:predicted 3-demethylubiquinone-9 3-methyltransferase (glyoxalase superfamily)